jgi:hypothetical protein
MLFVMVNENKRVADVANGLSPTPPYGKKKETK